MKKIMLAMMAALVAMLTVIVSPARATTFDWKAGFRSRCYEGYACGSGDTLLVGEHVLPSDNFNYGPEKSGGVNFEVFDDQGYRLWVGSLKAIRFKNTDYYNPSPRINWTSLVMPGNATLQIPQDQPMWLQFCLYFTDERGEASDYAQFFLQINTPAPPTCTLTASPNSIGYGGTTTLSWTTTNADTFAINYFILNAGVGSINDSPATSTVYTGIASGPGGTASCSATVIVDGQPVPCSQYDPDTGICCDYGGCKG